MTTIGTYTTRVAAERAIEELKARGIGDAEISYMYTNVDGKVTDGNTGNNIENGVASGATTGAVIGAIAGLVVAAGVIPGLGALFVAGPLAAALGLTGTAATTVAGAVTGLAAGGIIGGLVNLGVDKNDAQEYEESIRSGNVLVVAHGDENIREIFQSTGADRIKQYA